MSDKIKPSEVSEVLQQQRNPLALVPPMRRAALLIRALVALFHLHRFTCKVACASSYCQHIIVRQHCPVESDKIGPLSGD